MTIKAQTDSERSDSCHLGELKNGLRRLFAEHGINMTIGQYASGRLFLQSHDSRIVTLEIPED